MSLQKNPHQQLEQYLTQIPTLHPAFSITAQKNKKP